MHPVDIRGHNADLIAEIAELLRASHVLMRAATNENPPANIAQAKAIISNVAEMLTGIVERMG